MTEDFEVTAVRCTAQPDAYGAFLGALGLTPVISAGEQAVYAGRGGRVWVRSADAAVGGLRPGLSALAFTVPDPAAAAERLRATGCAVGSGERGGWSTWVRDRRGGGIGLAEAAGDNGPELARHPASASMDVVARYPSGDFRADAEFFAAFGLLGGAVDDPWRCGLRSMAHRGVVSLDAADPDNPDNRNDPEGPALVTLGFETSEPLDALAGRLRAAGYGSATVDGDDSAPYVDVVDPDGRHVEIHLTA